MREYLKELRAEYNLTMQEVADKLGISRQYYQYIEAGERQQKMDITLVSRLAALYGVSIEFIIGKETSTDPTI